MGHTHSYLKRASVTSPPEPGTSYAPRSPTVRRPSRFCRDQAVERQWKELSEQDKNFDQGLKDILTKDQQTRYQRWKQDRQNEQRGRWRGRWSAQDREGWSSRSQPR